MMMMMKMMKHLMEFQKGRNNFINKNLFLYFNHPKFQIIHIIFLLHITSYYKVLVMKMT